MGHKDDKAVILLVTSKLCGAALFKMLGVKTFTFSWTLIGDPERAERKVYQFSF